MMNWIDGKISLTPDFLMFHFDDYINFTDYPEINNIFIALKGSEHYRQLLSRNGAGTPWKLQIATEEGETYESVLKRLLLTWDRVMNTTPEEIRKAYNESLNEFNGSTILPYREPVDVEE